MRPPSDNHDRALMRRALKLARRGAGFVSPNPLVGAVIAKNGRVVAEGYHHACGDDHAEVDALKKLDFKAPGLDLYVTLEPCVHHGHTPPCTDAIIRAGIRRVCVAMVDPNPLVAGKGIAKLRRAGIEVEVGLLENDARRLNEAFICFISARRPFVVAKAALSLDGRIATASGDSGQKSGGISSPEAHRYVQGLRHDLDAILVGAGTVTADNPRLTCRLNGRVRQPLRIVLDGQGLSSPQAQVFDSAAAPTLVATTRTASAEWRKAVSAKGAEVVVFKGRKGRLDVRDLLMELGRRCIGSLLVEGGGQILAAFLAADCIDRLDLLYAPRLIGALGVPLIDTAGQATLSEAWRLSPGRTRHLGRDLLVQSYPESPWMATPAAGGQTCLPG